MPHRQHKPFLSRHAPAATPGAGVDPGVPAGPIFCNAVNKQRRRSQTAQQDLSGLYEYVNELWALRKAEVADVTARCAVCGAQCL